MSTSISSTPDRTVEPREAAELDELLAPLMVPAYRLAFGMLRDREDAEDAVQEAALRAWRHRQRFRPGADPRPWFFAIVANQCRSVRRGRWSRLLRVDSLSTTLTHAFSDQDVGLDLRRAVGALGHDDRLVLVLRYYMDLSYEDVAATLGVSEEAARSRTQRAVRRLRPKIVSAKGAD